MAWLLTRPPHNDNGKNMQSALLTIRDLKKSYLISSSLFCKQISGRFRQALAGATLTLGPGLYGLLGPNGAGKSTLINIITGSLAADSGEVLWCGKLARGIAFRRILGYMPQQQGLYDSYTGRRFLAYMAALKELPRKNVPAEVDRVAAAVNLSNELDKRLSAYSGGMKQRLLLASALLGDPKLLILDEPTAGLDPKERVRLRELLAEMATNRIILVATHVVSDVETVAREVILLRAGKIVDAAPVPELIEKYAPGQGLEEVYAPVVNKAPFFPVVIEHFPRIVGHRFPCSSCRSSKQRCNSPCCLFTGQSRHFDFTAVILILEIKGQAPHLRKVLHPELPAAAR